MRPERGADRILSRADDYFSLGRISRWYSPKRMKVGGHWPTKSAQWSCLASLSRAEAQIEPSASQYQVSSGMLSVTRKNCFCVVSAFSVERAIVRSLSSRQDPNPGEPGRQAGAPGRTGGATSAAPVTNITKHRVGNSRP